MHRLPLTLALLEVLNVVSAIARRQSAKRNAAASLNSKPKGPLVKGGKPRKSGN
jgi:hypothetical protein